MSRRISDEALETLHLKAAGEARHASNKRSQAKRRGLPKPGKALVYVDANDLACILDELRKRRSQSKRSTLPTSELTRKLIKMNVGDTIIVEAVTNSKLTTNRATARKALDNPNARWRAESLPDGKTKITRRPDGTKHIYGLPRNPIIGKLAAMNIGQRMTVEGIERLTNAWKILAREEMEKPRAQWKTQRLANGKLKIWRVN